MRVLGERKRLLARRLDAIVKLRSDNFGHVIDGNYGVVATFSVTVAVRTQRAGQSDSGDGMTPESILIDLEFVNRTIGAASISSSVPAPIQSVISRLPGSFGLATASVEGFGPEIVRIGNRGDFILPANRLDGKQSLFSANLSASSFDLR